MKFTPPAELKDFTLPTKYCNADNAEVVKTAEDLASNADSPGEAALKIHSWIRDRYPFGFSPVDEKASETLKAGYGWCVTKTNLQIAMLRALGIPARFHQVVLSKKVLKDLISGPMYRVIQDPIWFHPWCECYLDKQWITCDLWIDRLTHQAALNAGLYDPEHFPTVEWNGTDDLNIVGHWLREDRGTLVSYDHVVEDVAASFKKFPPVLVNWLLRHSNRYTDKFRRRHGNQAQS